MKALLVGIFTLGTMSFAHATTGSMEAELAKALAKGISHYDFLAKILLDGNKKPNLDKLAGTALSGRCFTDRSPNEEVNAGFLIRKQKGFYEAFLYDEVRGEADFFDGMTAKEVLDWNPRISSVEINESFFAVDRPHGFSSFEQSGQYLIPKNFS